MGSWDVTTLAELREAIKLGIFDVLEQALDESYRADLWMLPDDGSDAVALEPSGEGPSGRAGAEMVTDPDSRRVLLGLNDGGLMLWDLAAVNEALAPFGDPEVAGIVLERWGSRC